MMLALLVIGIAACSSDVDLGARDGGPGSDSGTQDTGAGDTNQPDSVVDSSKPDGPPSDLGCPPMPSCNWCGGKVIKDSNGCGIGYECANGANPCAVPPCSKTAPTGCKPDEHCGSDQLCWPKGDGGVPPCNWCGGTSIKDAKGCTVGFKCANGADPCVTQPCTGSSMPVCGPNEYCDSADQLCWPYSTKKDAGVGSSCGALLTCTSAEYCEQIEPSYCTGSPLPDGGTCPPNCQAKVCTPGGSPVCVCDSFSCRKLPAGCTSCSCISTPPPGPCTCQVGPGGAIHVSCGAP
jgi:hypothetical protein